MDFVAGALPHAPAAEVEAHMARCNECRRLIVEIARSNQADTDLDAAPPSEVQRAADAIARKTTAPGTRRQTAPRASKLKLGRGAQVGRYTLLYPLGEGGMGSVHAAFDPKLDRRVALKFLRTDLMGTTETGHRERLVREARALARLSHANVVSIFDVAETDGSVFLAMELIEGSNARIWRELGNRSIDEIVRIYRGSLSALMAAHDQGIIHRDFKPDNVMVGADGIARVTDFGLARAAMVDVNELLAVADAKGMNWETLTQTGLVLGTPRYMAPEQFSGVANEHTDQFSFCLSMYEALYGHYPLGTTTPRALLPDKDISEQILSPLNRGLVPEPLRRALLRGMAINPADRWPTMAELDYELAQIARPKINHWRWPAAGAIAAAVVATAFVLAPSPRASPTSPPRPDFSDENRELRAEIERRNRLDEELAMIKEENLLLIEKLSAREREIELERLAEETSEQVAKLRRSSPPLPIHNVERSVTTRLSEILACYESSVDGSDEKLIKVLVGITREGTVEWVTPPYQGSQVANHCLERALKRLDFPASSSETTATLHLSFFRLESGMLAVNMRAKTRTASLGQVTVDSHGRVLIDCSPNDPLCGL